MSLFKKPNRIFRRKITNDSDSENEQETNSNESKSESSGNEIQQNVVTETFKTKPKKVVFKTSLKTPSLLSFDEDEETEVFKVKKSSHSRRLAKQIQREKEKKDKKDGIDEPKKEETIASIEKNETVVLNGADAEEISVGLSDDDDDIDNEPLSPRDPFRKFLETGAIPDAAMIHAARKRRQLAREMGDFIPVDDSQRFENNKSRLVRDDDNDLSDPDDEEEGRINFTVNTSAQERQKTVEAFYSAEHGGSDESDHADGEFELWEQEQIRKGVSIPQIQATQQLKEQEQYIYSQYVYPQQLGVYQQPMTYDQYAITTAASAAVMNKPKILPPMNQEDVTGEEVKRCLKERLDSLEQVNSAHQREMEKISQQLIDSQDTIIRLEEEEAPLMARRFTFYQEMRGYVRDLVECLNEKVPRIEALEASLHSLCKTRASGLVLRRQDDIKDQSEEFTYKTYAFNREKQMDNTKVRRIAEREGRRTRRRKARETTLTSGGPKHHDGLSSDDEEIEREVAKFNTEVDRILNEANTVFQDVIDDFSTIGAIKYNFERWKFDEPESYNDAYISLCLPKLITPLIRLELIGWNPLLDGCVEIEEMSWYKSLLLYGFLPDQEDDAEDCDTNLLPSLIDKAVLPKLTYLAENIWDPVSTSQTQRLVRIVEKLVNDYSTVHANCKNTQVLLKAIVDRMRKTLDDDVFMPFFPKTALENRSSGPFLFAQRQFWTCIKLLDNFLSWHKVLSQKTLTEIAIDGLLNRFILLGLQNTDANKDSLERCKTITSKLPKQFFTGLKKDNTLTQLEPLCRYLNHCADSLDKSSFGGNQLEKNDAKEGIREITKILVNIHAMDHALSLATQFSLKDLKTMVTVK